MSDLLASFPPELGELLARIRASIALVDAEQLTQLANDRPLTQDAFNSITSQIKQELHRVDNNLEVGPNLTSLSHRIISRLIS
jgi:hypothetical protein